MDFHVSLSLSLCFLFLLPHLSNSAFGFPIWLRDKKTQRSILGLHTGTFYPPIDPTRVTQLTRRPRAFIYRNFLTGEECDHIINLARDKLEKSMVVEDETGKSAPSEYRTSSGMFIEKAQDEVIARIEAKLAAWTFLPIENGEVIQVLRYERGQKYEPHYDYILDKEHQQPGGQRIVTVIMYLSNVEKGGETVFPDSESQPKDDNWSACAKNGYSVKPRKGDALLFYSLQTDATLDPMSWHASCPVIEGEKWCATKWIRVRSFDRDFECTDEDEHCALWAAAGECEKNPKYMVGTKNTIGYCRKSCNVAC